MEKPNKPIINDCANADIMSEQTESYSNITTVRTDKKAIKLRNIISVRQLILNENAKLEQIYNPKTGKYFFRCGSKQGYISPAANELLSQKDSGADDFIYAEVNTNGSPDWVPIIMAKHNPQKHRDNEKPLEDNNVSASPTKKTSQQRHKKEVSYEPQKQPKTDQPESGSGKLFFYVIVAFFILMNYFMCTHSDHSDSYYDGEPIHMFRGD